MLFQRKIISVSSSFNMPQHIHDLPISAIQIVPISGILSKLNVFHPLGALAQAAVAAVSENGIPGNEMLHHNSPHQKCNLGTLCTVVVYSIFRHTHISLRMS